MVQKSFLGGTPRPPSDRPVMEDRGKQLTKLIDYYCQRKEVREPFRRVRKPRTAEESCS